MKSLLTLLSLLITVNLVAQQTAAVIDPLSFGVILDHPDVKNVIKKADITYLQDSKGTLRIDVYAPPKLNPGETRPAVIFLNAVGDRPGGRPLKSWGIYSSWPALIAAHGYIGISMEADGSRIPESIESLFKFLDAKGAQYNIDAERLGVYAASANVSQASPYLMNETAYRGIKAAVLYYGRAPAGPYRKDLPVLYVIAEGDVRPNSHNNLMNEVLKNNAPWTIRMGTGMPHGFDAYTDNDEARKILKETISFWKNHLDPVPQPSWQPNKGREVIGTMQMDRPKAVSMLETLVKENPKDVGVLNFYADALRQSQKNEEAGKYYQQILVMQPDNVEVMIKMAAVSYAQNKPADAEGYINKAVKTGKMSQNDYSQLGLALLIAEKNKEAAVYYEKAITLGPRAIDYYNLGCAYAKVNEKDKAFMALEQAAKLGYDSKAQYENDGDLTSLRSDSRYKAILEKLK
jgi:tetratricopeptide (TPR) repeat protein